MSPGSRLRLDRLVLEAASLEPGERTAFLADLAAEDRGIAEEVRRRLRSADDLPESFLRAPATELLEAACAELGGDEPPPTGDERYEIGECLGTGGMARVFRAFDRHLGRPVALKLLQATDPETPRRLLREARAQARVRHDHVLDVYETGELDGCPYIAVRFVAGGTLADLDQSTSLEQKVRLVAQVAEGLHAAHREGLLHGDVKPSNVMVEETPDGELRAWIGDFGIATEIESSDSDDDGLAGTPQFMAPERLHGDRASADRRSDVFSLGVTLHRILTGAPPPRPDVSWTELRARSPGVPPDLAAVVVRCLAGEPGDRYPSARAVAEELRRFLDGEVVEAYADRWAYRMTRFVARHRTLLTVAGISGVLLAVALLVAAAMGVRAVRANTRADQRRGQAEDLIGFMLLDLREKLQGVGRLDLLDEVGERAMDYFAAVPEDELTDEELARRSTALHQIGDVRMRQGDLEGAELSFRESLEQARRLAARGPGNAERLFDLGQSEFWVGYASWERGNLEAAHRHFESYHDISERLVAMDPENLDWRRELSYAQSNLGSLLEQQGDLVGALERFRAALALDLWLVENAATPQEADEHRFELAASRNTVGVILEKLGRLDEAREHYQADLALRRELLVRDPQNQPWRAFLATSHQFLGALLLVRGEIAEARPHLEEACRLFDDLAERDPDNGGWAYKRAWSHLWLGQLEDAVGRRREARAAWHRGAEIARRLAARDPAREDWRELLGVVRYHLALAADTPEAARSEILGALAILEPAVEGREGRPDKARAARWLAEALLLLGDLEAAREEDAAAKQAWSRAARTLEPFLADRPRAHPILVPWKRALLRLGRSDEAAQAMATLDALGVASPDTSGGAGT